MFGRILGILTFRRATYLEVAKDRNAIGQAVILVVISSLLYGFIGVAIVGIWAGAGRGNIVHVIGRGAIASFSAFAGWIIIAVLLVLVAALFQGKSTVGEMLRVTGFVGGAFSIPVYFCGFVLVILGAVSAVEVVVGLIAVLELGGYTIGVSEAAGITMRRAFVTSLIASFVGFFAVILFADLIMTALKIPAP